MHNMELFRVGGHGGAWEHMVQLPKVPMVWYLELGILGGYDLLGRS